MKTINYIAKDVKLIVDKEIDIMAAEASISLNPNVTWMKIVLTDDGYNANRQRVPRNEYPNVLRTGVFMPLKMSQGSISEGHDNAQPLGALTHLKVNGNTVEALAALWERERSEDVLHLKERYANKLPIDVSWELTYEDSVIDEEGETFMGVSMNGACIVGMPAYEGRTPAVAIASQQETQNGDENMDKDTISVQEHEAALAALKEEYESKLVDLESRLATLETANTELASFKQAAEEDAKQKAKFASVKEKFTTSGLSLSDEYFTERYESFINMSDEQVDFLVQELLTVAKAAKASTEVVSVNVTSSNIPEISGTSDTIEPNDIVNFLRSLDRSK